MRLSSGCTGCDWTVHWYNSAIRAFTRGFEDLAQGRSFAALSCEAAFMLPPANDFVAGKKLSYTGYGEWPVHPPDEKSDDRGENALSHATSVSS